MRKYPTVLAVAAAAALLAPGSAGAATIGVPLHLSAPLHTATPAGHGHGHGHGHHHGDANCNNDPDSGFAMDPDVCPPSNNSDAYDDEDRDPGER